MTTCPVCSSIHIQRVYTYTHPPAGETVFPFTERDYRRTLLQCIPCKHCWNEYGFDCDWNNFYGSVYNQATYGDRFQQEYARIQALPFEQSNNKQRVANLKRYMMSIHADIPRRVLDVGSGLCVFLAEMVKTGYWTGTAIDPDPRSVAHARDIGVTRYGEVTVIEGAFGEGKFYDIGEFDLITFNNVIEHVQYPETVLAEARSYLAPEGVVYIEVPDGEEAVKRGQNQPELFVEHLHVFSVASLAMVASNAGLCVKRIDRIVEPNGNLTLRGYCNVRK